MVGLVVLRNAPRLGLYPPPLLETGTLVDEFTVWRTQSPRDVSFDVCGESRVGVVFVLGTGPVWRSRNDPFQCGLPSTGSAAGRMRRSEQMLG